MGTHKKNLTYTLLLLLLFHRCIDDGRGTRSARVALLTIRKQIITTLNYFSLCSINTRYIYGNDFDLRKFRIVERERES